VKWSEGLIYRVSNIIKRYIDHMKFTVCMAFSFITFFMFFCSIFYHFLYGYMLCLLLYYFLNYIFLLLYLCILIVMYVRF